MDSAFPFGRDYIASRKEENTCFVRISPKSGTGKWNMASAKEWRLPTEEKYSEEDARRAESSSRTDRADGTGFPFPVAPYASILKSPINHDLCVIGVFDFNRGW